ncbi:DUF3307 domain-containing protein [Ruegeria sp. HKCCD6228]|uniref:DUF3307 domain-containing protein n=2 Tax=Roseobacteraceae TaxID=2854170 RepID=A0AA91BRJ2_9RHOB|nr:MULTISPECIES: DUF3307 domain-containing protein [Ruegeria]MCA0907640.1 DUF3307 domain-containing protein [Ruegeria marisrubri]NOC84484.1 DUF3307 domain-containing protein [Ruegeria sp. HKCCD6428]NOD30922.1 DUF3307 domain-containing protein [Ruegeria atlantica]NOD97312.1 DUF3307 domain-containing protein [Ruegeria sp. HKCCD6228]NOE18642.1 DUF3307 domain-containing protein [Ruegeria atlantica]
MTASIGAVFLMLCLLLIKHMFADYYLQTPKMLSGRGEYFHLGRAQHAAVHVVGSVVVFLVFGAPLSFILIVGALEWFIHFNIDFIKASYSDKKRLEPTQPAFWRAAGLDQLMHNLTYVAMVWAWVTFAAA